MVVGIRDIQNMKIGHQDYWWPQSMLFHFILERVTGIEPASPAWKADALTIVLYPLIRVLLSTKSRSGRFHAPFTLEHHMTQCFPPCIG